MKAKPRLSAGLRAARTRSQEGKAFGYPEASKCTELQSMEIQIDSHTLERAEERGTDEAQIREVILTGLPIPAKYGRSGRAKVFDFNRTRLGKYYKQKRAEVYYTIEGNKAITATVYVFYGVWEV